MNKLAVITFGTAVGAGVGFGLGVGAGGVVDGINGEKTKVATVEEHIQGYKADLSEYETRDGTLIKYGEACLTLLGNYAPGGPLSNVSQDVAVADSLANPDQPCGDDATQVRIVVQEVLGVKSQLSVLQSEDINASYRKIDSINENNRADDEYELWLYAGGVMAVIGGLVGAAAGKVAYSDITDEKPKARRQ